MAKPIGPQTLVPIGFAFAVIWGYVSQEKGQDMAIASNAQSVEIHSNQLRSLESESKNAYASLEAKLSVALQDLATIKGEMKQLNKTRRHQ